MYTSSVDSNLQALQVFGRSLAETAHNIANVNTPEFESRRVDLADGPGGQGVEVAAVLPDTTEGPLQAASSGLPSQVRSADHPGYVEGSNTDLATELVNVIRDERAFQANATAIRMRMEAEGVVMSELTGFGSKPDAYSS